MRKKKVVLIALPAIDANQCYDIVPETCNYLRLSRASIYKLIARGELRVIRRGGRTFTPGSELIRMAQLPDDAPSPQVRGRKARRVSRAVVRS